jgi:hypothetical protein
MAGASCLKSNRWFVFVGVDDGTTLRRLNGVFLILCLRRITSRRHHLCREHMVEGRLAGRAELQRYGFFGLDKQTRENVATVVFSMS